MTKNKPTREEMDQLALSIGRVVIVSSQLEHCLTMVVAGILALNEVQERTLVRPMATNVKLTLLNRIAKDYLKPNDCKRVTKTTGEIKDVAEKRNDLMHGIYVHHPETLEAAILSFSGAARIKGNPTKITPRDLELFIAEISSLIDRMNALQPLFPKIETAPGPSHSVPKTTSNTQP